MILTFYILINIPKAVNIKTNKLKIIINLSINQINLLKNKLEINFKIFRIIFTIHYNQKKIILYNLKIKLVNFFF